MMDVARTGTEGNVVVELGELVLESLREVWNGQSVSPTRVIRLRGGQIGSRPVRHVGLLVPTGIRLGVI